jgi:hypothetical protein
MSITENEVHDVAIQIPLLHAPSLYRRLLMEDL